MSEKAVICHQLYKSFAQAAVIRDVSLTIHSGHILALLGPSGCGKTTTLRLIAGFEHLDSGRIEIGGRVVADDRFHLPPEKRRVGMVFQDYAIFPHLTVAQNVAFGLGRGQDTPARTEALLAMVGLSESGEQMPHELSGGQQQRVALARALAPEPAVLLLDEPFSNLDTSLRAQVRQEVRELLKQNQATAIFVTHDQEEALFIGDQIAVMNEGRVEQVGTPEIIFHRPQTLFVAEFMGHTDFITGQVTEAGVETGLGLLPQSLSLPHGAEVKIALRPDDVQIEAGNGSNGRILSRQFVGIAHVYHVVLSEGSHVHSWQPHTLDLAPGTAVQATFTLDHPLACFYNGRRVSE